MATLQVGGLASGLDTESLITKLLAVDQQPITLLRTNKAKFQAVSTAFTDLNSKLLTLKGQADALKDPGTFFPRAVTSSSESVATATAAPGSARGSYSLTMTSLARGSIAAATTTVGALTSPVADAPGDFQFKVGAGGSTIDIPYTETTTLNDLVAAINAAGAGVKAAAVNAGTSAIPAYKLTLTSTSTGAANNIVIVSDLPNLTVTNTQPATDAKFTLSGLGDFSRASNTFSDVLDGVTITLKSASGSTDLSVDVDKAATQAKVQALIDSYNTVVHTIDSQTEGTTNSDGSVSAGAFTGDATTHVIRLGLSGSIATTVAGSLTTLAEIGITTQRDGTLALDATRFQQALAADPDAVSTLVAGTDTHDGIADILSARIAMATKSLTGSIAARQDGLSTSMKSLQDQIDGAQSRLAVTETQLRAKFANLEQIIAQLQTTGNSLLSSLANLNTSFNSKSNSSSF
jgi:flagellar hook-associated protein 2